MNILKIFHKCYFDLITVISGNWYKDEEIENVQWCPAWWYYKCKCGKYSIAFGNALISGEFPKDLNNKEQNKWLLKQYHPINGIIREVHE